GNHHARVRSIRARGDRRDQHVAVAEFDLLDSVVRVWNAVGCRPVVDHLGLGPGICVFRKTGFLVGHALDRLLASAFDVAAGGSDHRGVSSTRVFGGLVVAVFAHRLEQELAELLLQLAERDSGLRPFWSGNAWLNRSEMEFEKGAVVALTAARDSKHALRLKVASDQVYLLVGPAGRVVVSASLVVYGKETHRRSVLGRHVGDRSS